MKANLCLLLLVFLMACKANTIDTKMQCRSVHIGEFWTESEALGVTIITRTNKYQVEINAKKNIHYKYKVSWIDDCSYRLDFLEKLNDNKSKANMVKPVKVRIIDVTEKHYTIIGQVIGEENHFEVKVYRK